MPWRGERGQHAVGGGGGDAALRGDLAQRQAVAVGDDGQDASSARSSDCTEAASAGRVEGARAPALAFFGGVHVAILSDGIAAIPKMKKFFEFADAAIRWKTQNYVKSSSIRYFSRNEKIF